MKSDFSRISFDPAQVYSAVLHQQGRVQTDADLNEQSAIHSHAIASLASSLTGLEGAILLPPPGPVQILPGVPGIVPAVIIPIERPLSSWQVRDLPGFKICEMTATVKQDIEDSLPAGPQRTPEEAALSTAIHNHRFWISPGHYYAEGKRCEVDAWTPLNAQPYKTPAAPPLLAPRAAGDASTVAILYLDAWERTLSWLDEPSISDVALGRGVDTAMRTKLVWQVKVLVGTPAPAPVGPAPAVPTFWDRFTWESSPPWKYSAPTLRVQMKPTPGGAAPGHCLPESAGAWLGLENLLYRVEIHSPPVAAMGANLAQPPKFKWSRENGSVIAAVRHAVGSMIRVFPALLKAGGIRAGDILEIIRDSDELAGKAGDLVRAGRVLNDAITLEPVTAGAPIPTIRAGDRVRRWDQRGCSGGLVEISKSDEWIDLEDGIQVSFHYHNATDFRPGDYWTIPSRTGRGGVIWPEKKITASLTTDLSNQLLQTSLPPTIGLPPAPGFPLPDGIGFANGLPLYHDGAPASPKVTPGEPAAVPPHGVRHHYALLSFLGVTANDWGPLVDCRRILHLAE